MKKPSYTLKDSMVRIDVCTGTVYFRVFSRFTVSCHLRYEWYPFDEQASRTFAQ